MLYLKRLKTIFTIFLILFEEFFLFKSILKKFLEIFTHTNLALITVFHNNIVVRIFFLIQLIGAHPFREYTIFSSAANRKAAKCNQHRTTLKPNVFSRHHLLQCLGFFSLLFRTQQRTDKRSVCALLCIFLAKKIL